jgi:hypothetical protein
MSRSKKAPAKIANGLMYQTFKAIRYLVTTANRKSENALVTIFRDRIPSLPSRYQLPKTELAKNWFSLERAIRQAYRSDPRPRALICEITKRYFALIRSQSQVEVALIEQFEITLSKRPEHVKSSQHVKPHTGADGNDKMMKASG